MADNRGQIRQQLVDAALKRGLHWSTGSVKYPYAGNLDPQQTLKEENSLLPPGYWDQYAKRQAELVAGEPMQHGVDKEGRQLEAKYIFGRSRKPGLTQEPFGADPEWSDMARLYGFEAEPGYGKSSEYRDEGGTGFEGTRNTGYANTIDSQTGARIDYHELGHVMDHAMHLWPQFADALNTDTALQQQFIAASADFGMGDYGAKRSGNEMLADNLAYYITNGDIYDQKYPEMAKLLRRIVNSQQGPAGKVLKLSEELKQRPGSGKIPVGTRRPSKQKLLS